MATTIKIKSSNVASKVPTDAQLATGELALNFPDKKLYTKDPNGDVILIASGTTVAYADTSFTATASQTTFTVDYTVGGVDVYLNGIKLDSGDFTATNGTSVVLGTGAEVGSTILVRAWSLDVSLQGPQGEQGDPATVTTTNVTAAGALMDSEVTNLAQVKAFDSADYATAAQGTLAASALQSVAFGDLTTTPTTKSGYGITDVYTTTQADSAISTAIGNLIDSAPTALDTLNELAASLGDDADFAGTMTTNLATKLPLAGGALTGAVTTTSTFDGRDVATDGTKLDTIDTNANNYVHPTHPGDDASVDTGALTGATVISNLDFNITTDTAGHVTDANATVATRTLTLANLGYTGATDANNYTHPTHPGDNVDVNTGVLTGATVISNLDFNITTDTAGHVTDANALVATRNITLANLGYTGETNATADQTKADIDALGIDAETLDGINSTSFLRSDANDSTTGSITITNDAGLFVKTATNGAGAKIDFSDAQSGSYAQVGTIKYLHQDGTVTGSGVTSNDGFVISGTETNTVVRIEGHLVATGDITAYSDERLKENVEIIDGAVEKVNQLRGVTYDRKDGTGSSTGLIAQDVHAVLPEAVVEDDEGMMSVKYGNLVGLLVESVKELSAKIEAQQEEINNLKSQ